MKNILNLLPLLLLFSALSALAGPQTVGIKPGYAGQVPLQSATVKVTPALAFKPRVTALPEYDETKCRRFKGMLIGGAVALGVGVPLVVGGTVVFLNGLGVNDGEVNGLFIAGGVLMTLAGIAGTSAGIPLLAIGASKTRRYCGKNESSMNLQLIKHGNTAGLALRF